MTLVSVDQSFSHCAVVVFKDGKPKDRLMIRTGDTKAKVKSKGVEYFPIITQQIDHICDIIVDVVKSNNAEAFVMEGVSQGSYGDAKGYLITLFRAIKDSLIENSHLSESDIHSVAPTAVKSFARELLPEEEQTFMKTKVDKKSGKEVQSRSKIKMEKSHMVRACEIDHPGWLDGLTLAAGKADYADAYLIGKAFMKRQEAKS